MIDTRRTRQMTKMAIFEKEKSDDYETTARHDRRAYIATWTAVYVIGAVIVGLLYVLAALYIILSFNSEGVGAVAWILFGVAAVIGFVSHTFFYVRQARRRVMARYDDNKKKSDYIEEQYKVLEAMYEEHS